jgi:glycosyltransferase involved in cell wall biosynthesis
MTRCSIVIRACNEEKHLGNLLTGILRQTVREVEILLVDSGSTDSTLSVASRFPVRVLTLPTQEFTFGRSLNLGLEHATSNLVVIASAHVYPLYDDWLERLLDPFRDPAVALTYGRQTGNELTRYSERQVFAQMYPEAASRDQAHPFCNNANASVRRSVWEHLRYDETLTGLEDLEFAKRLQQRGGRITYVPEAAVAHVHEETAPRLFNRYRREAMALRQIYPSERFHLGNFVGFLAANVLSDMRHAWGDGRLRTSLADILSFRLMQSWGTYRGFATRGAVTSELRRKFYYPTRADRSETRVLSSGRPIEYPERRKGRLGDPG